MNNFYNLKFRDENELIEDLLSSVNFSNSELQNIEDQARIFIDIIRKKKSEVKGFNALMQSYDLNSQEGLALMTMAEALLRIPDVQTTNDLITDKLSDGDWSSLFEHSSTLLGGFSGYGLSFSQKIMDSMVGKLGMPVIRKACIEAMKLMGRTFVLGRDIDEAIKVAQPEIEKGYLFNFDMLGEGARTINDAEYYFDAYANAIESIGKSGDYNGLDPLHRPGISIKLSALYPRYEFAKSKIAEKILTEKLMELCAIASQYNLNVTVDAEECDRLALSLKIIENIIADPITKTWDGFGFALQAYQKRAMAIIDMALDWVKIDSKKISIRLVKGAYWDSEIKHAQIEGHQGYPVFTRKENTDLSYIACAKKLLDNRDSIYPMFGTHNAQTAATILQLAKDERHGFMFQRLHGMGGQLFEQLKSLDIPVCVYAPVGTHKYLLAYLVRRLLENGANSSFVNKIYNDKTPIADLTINPIISVQSHGDNHTHPKIPLPMNLFPNRANSNGLDISESEPLIELFETIKNNEEKIYDAPSVVDGRGVEGNQKNQNINPSNHHDVIGHTYYADDDLIQNSYAILQSGFNKWNETDVKIRAEVLYKIADLYEENTLELMALLIREAGKTVADAIAELREAVDFCRYYAMQGQKHFTRLTMDGPTGEDNYLMLEGRGIFACVSPWNFPLAIFTGQIVAALVAGNSVIAKPAEQTPAIATFAVKLMLDAGVPNNVIALLQGDGAVGSKIINHPNLAGVAFTGSTQVAKIIQRQIANKDGAIIPLIAETGGLNVMIVDSSSLPEQVTDDVIHSAFGSAGQRCSALRILCIQEDIADEVIKMIKGAMDCLETGDPQFLSTDIGPIIDDEAKGNLVSYQNRLDGIAKHCHRAPNDDRLDAYGTYLSPFMAELDSVDDIETEAFGPILHIVRYKESNLENLINKINNKGFGLTFGLHSRIHSKQQKIISAINAGNIYINRGQTGAVVGVQPFGGRGLSGTGPKAGGPYYLHAFATEKSISDNITASGGNASLINL